MSVGRHPQAAPNPEAPFDAIVHRRVGPEVLPGGPEHQSAGPGTSTRKCGPVPYEKNLALERRLYVNNFLSLCLLFFCVLPFEQSFTFPLTLPFPLPLRLQTESAQRIQIQISLSLLKQEKRQVRPLWPSHTCMVLHKCFGCQYI